MRIVTAGLSKVGGRKANQDCYGAEAGDNGGCWAVADGLGGHAGGETASRMAVETVLQRCRQALAVTAGLIGDCFRDAQAAIVQKAAENYELAGMRTTMVLLVADAQNAVWGHVGDSRLYWFRQGKIIQQTRDHSVPQMLADAGKIRPEDIRGHEDQNRLTRAIGQAGELRPTIPAAPFPVQAGDAALLCSDGVWTYVWESEMEADLAAVASPADWLARLEQRILARAEGPYDNYTAVAVWFQGV